MFVAVHSEGEGEVRQVLQQAGAQVMLEVPEGRIGHRHAWWPLDKYDEECKDWAEQRRGLANPKKEAVWLVRLGRGHWVNEATVGEARRSALTELEDLGTHYVAGGLAGLELRWGCSNGGTVQLSEDRAYLRQLGECLGLTAVRPPHKDVEEALRAASIDEEQVMERVGQGDTMVERKLGAELKCFREEDQEWMRCGVVTKQAEWVAEHVMGMGRRKGQWLEAVVRSKQQVCAKLERKFRGAIQLWLQYRGVMAGARVGQEGAYPCSCCKRWWRTVFSIGETGGKEVPSQILTARARAGRMLQRVHLRQPQESWDSMVVGTKVRVPAAGWYDDREDHGAVLHGVVVAVEEMKDHPELAVPGVAGERVVLVNFTHKEAHVQVEEKEGQTVRREVGERATDELREMDGGE